MDIFLNLFRYVDLINVMTYDFFGTWDTTAGHNSPLYGAARYVGTEYADYSIVSISHVPLYYTV